MKVHELIKELERMPQEAELVVDYEGYYGCEICDVIKPELDECGNVLVAKVKTEY